MGSEIKTIFRDEADEIKALKGWIILYGRRKVGKTFLIKNFLDYDVFFRVNRDGSISAEKFAIDSIKNVQDFPKIVSGLLSEGKTAVIDEFQRLPEDVLESISTAHPNGKLMLSGSSMRVVKRIAGRKSPLLGLALQFRLGLVKPDNMLRELSKKLDAVQAVEIAPYLSDPWTIPFFIKESTSIETIYQLLKYSKLTVPALVGEIFSEEEREFSRVYEAVLRLIGAGEWDYKNVASTLSERKLIERADSSLVLPYMKNMVDMGLLSALPVYGSRKKMYRLSSPVMEAFYYLADRYNFEEADVSLEEVRPTIERLRNLAIQNFVGDLFALAHDGRKEYYVTPSKEIDFVITSRGRPVMVGEVKWGSYDNRDMIKFEEKSRFLRSAERVFVTKRKISEKTNGIRIVDADGIIDIANRMRV